MSKKVEELLPNILRNISNGISVSTKDIEKRYGVSASSVRAHLRSLKKNFYKNCYKYDGSSKKWVAIESGFLNKMLIKPEEVMVLNAMMRNSEKLDNNMTKWYSDVINNYIKRTSSFIFKQHSTEKITKDMEQLFAQIHVAIDEKNKISFNFKNCKRIVYPFKIINIEYYWYLLGFEESSENKTSKSQKIKTYTVFDIKSLEIINQKFKYDFSLLNKLIENAMNTFFIYGNSIITVVLLIENNFLKYINRASFFNAWKKTGVTETHKDVKYTQYEAYVTNPQFREIIPTILKYMPNILVEEPQELRDKLLQTISEYQTIYSN